MPIISTSAGANTTWNFHSFFTIWDAEFGASTHAHGMYHFEFYRQIRKKLPGKCSLLSGIVGDLWAGSVPQFKINSPDQMSILGYTHNLRGNVSHLLLQTNHDLRYQFWENNIHNINDYRLNTVCLVRLKMILLSYLIRVPRLFDLEPWSHFLIDIAMAQLNLDPNEGQIDNGNVISS